MCIRDSLDAHADRAIARAQDEECRWVLASMGRFIRGKLPVRQKARVEEHLRHCRHAQGLAYEMAEVNRSLPALMVPLIFLSASSVAGGWALVSATAPLATGPRGPREENKAVAAASMMANIGTKAAALVAGLALGGGAVCLLHTSRCV